MFERDRGRDLRLSIRTFCPARSARQLLLAGALICASVALRPGVGLAQSARGARVSPPGSAPSPWREPPSARAAVERYQLKNGLRVVLEVDRTMPGFAACMSYALGSRDDPEGQAGAAWLLERVLAARTPGSPRARALEHLEKRGGSSRGLVAADATSYVSSGPVAALPRALELEAARLAKPAVTPRDFPELRRLGAAELESDRDLEAVAEQRLRQLVFQGHGPYTHLVKGTASSVSGIELAGVLGLHEQRMRAGGAVLSIVGNFAQRDVRRLVQHSLGGGAPRRAVPEPLLQPMPRQTSERFNASVSREATTPLAYYAWPIPSPHTGSGAALRLLAEILADADASRLRASLAAGEGLARDLRAWTFPHAGASALAVQLRIEAGSSVDQARALLERELQRLGSQGPTETELTRAKARVGGLLTLELATPPSRARMLAEHELWHGDASLALAEPGRYAALTRAEVRLAAAEYLIETRRTTVELYPPGWPQDPAPAVVRREHLVQAGENLIQIARRYHSSVDAIAAANRIRSHRFIFPGQKLIVPVETAEAGRAQRRTYTVKPGDSLSVIAKRHGVSTSALAAANRRKRDQRIVIGEKLTIPPVPRAAPASARKNRGLRQHRIKRGDTLIGLAKRYGVSPAELARANGKNPKRPILAGELLVIPSSTAAKPKPE